MKTTLRYSDSLKYYRVSIHKSGKYQYASTQPTVIDEKTGKKKSQYIHWGTLDDQLRFFPNKNFLNASEEVRSHLVFPDNWDLRLIEHLMPEEGEEKLENEKKRNELLDSYAATKRNAVGADQIYRLIRSLRETDLSSDAILDVVLSMENPA